MSYEDYEKGVNLLIEKYVEREKKFSVMLSKGSYATGEEMSPEVIAELEGQRHEIGHFIHDLEQLKVDGNQ